MGCCEASQSGKPPEVEALDVFRAASKDPAKDDVKRELDEPLDAATRIKRPNLQQSSAQGSEYKSSLKSPEAEKRRRDVTNSFTLGVSSVTFAQDSTKSTRLSSVAEQESSGGPAEPAGDADFLPDGLDSKSNIPRSKTQQSGTSTWSSAGPSSAQLMRYEAMASSRTPIAQAEVMTAQASRDDRPALRRALSTVAAGHGGMSIIKDFDNDADMTGIPMYINKKYDHIEALCYKELQDSNDPLLEFTPQYFGEVGGAGADSYMRLSNLLKPFMRSPHVMDCKLGIRSFSEDEVSKTELRSDLYEKLVLLDASAPTAEEMAKQACTKYRWMSFNDSYTGLDTLGFRIDGIANPNMPNRLPKRDLKILRSVQNCANCIAKHFLPFPADQELANDAEQTGEESKTLEILRERMQTQAASQILAGLKRLKAAFLRSPFAAKHSFVGTSLLFIADSSEPNVAVHLIDFAKTIPLPEGVSITHRAPWQPGNHEDGLLVGLDHMIETWEKVLDISAGLES
mmetsp:Transcript_64442/g.153769  ORF Transcript_64442/g.153769 Transcript_64442/m.153769 type:complete len:513 (-) Transcript_64442:107-1645(-)